MERLQDSFTPIDNITNTIFVSGNDFHRCSFANGFLIRYIGTSIFFLGILSTLLSIGVFTRKALRTKSCCFYFLVIAISDSIHLTTMTIEHLPHSFQIDLIIIHSVICKLIIFLIYFSNHLSNLVLTLASIDRFLLIYYPTRSKRFCKVEKAKWFVFIVIIILLISNGHILYGYERITLEESSSITPSYDCNIPNRNKIYNDFFHFYDSYIESIFFVLIPFVLMIFTSVMIIIQIVQSRRAIFSSTRAKNNQLRDKDVQLCCMLIGTSLAFLLLCLPAEVNDLFNYVDDKRSCFHWTRKVLLMLMQQIYFAGHFYIYTLTGQLFREHLFALICRGWCGTHLCPSLLSNPIALNKKTRGHPEKTIVDLKENQNRHVTVKFDQNNLNHASLESLFVHSNQRLNS